ncbi:MAG TPA: hypothetical protein VLT62_21105, partial [Candidatus Methylomirabilis sp.]|nr:hypothetical protein [Candidatus Methylomirabilis sp.]
MAWKIEQWLSDVFPGESEIYAEYRSLPPRELAVVAGAVLDLALAQLLAHRLMDNKKETESLLGLDGDGRAPVASFGSRIQLALLVGLITPADAEILRSIKSLRNLFAHRVNVSFISPEVVAVTTKLHELWVRRTAQLIAAGTLP